MTPEIVLFALFYQEDHLISRIFYSRDKYVTEIRSRSTLFIIFLARNSQLVPLAGSFKANLNRDKNSDLYRWRYKAMSQHVKYYCDVIFH